MNKRYFLAGLFTTVVLFLLNAIAYIAFLNNFFLSHPAVSDEFMKQLYLPADRIIPWALVLSTLAVGFLVTTVIYWSQARTIPAGLKAGFIFAILFLCSVDFGLLATTNNFSVAGAFADLTTSTITITISSAVAAWVLGRGKGTR